MSSPCTTCIKIDPIPSCADDWEIDGIPAEYDGLELFYVLTNLATGAVTTGLTEPVSGTIGMIVLDDDLTELMAHYYRLELYEDDTLQTRVQVTIGTTSACCIEFTTFDMATTTVYFAQTSCG